MHKTLRFQLTVLVALAGILLFLVSGLTISHLYGRELISGVDTELLGIAKTGQPDRVPGSIKHAELIKKVGDTFFRVNAHEGKITFDPVDGVELWPVNMESLMLAFKGSPRFETVTYRGERFRTLYFPLDEVTVVRVGKLIEDIENKISSLNRYFLFLSPFIMVLISVGSWVLLGKSLAPITTIRSIAEQIRQGRWDQKISLGVKGKEMDDLSNILNDIMNRFHRAVESQKRFTSDVSHEIRSPLTSLRGNIEVALRKKRTPEEYEDTLKNNLADVIRLSRTVDNLLFLSRADNKILELRRQWFDVKHLLETIVEGFRDKALAEDISITEDYQSGLELNGDIELLEQAFSNIIDNAIKYTPRDGKISIKTMEENAVIKIMVKDTGIGIAAEEIPHIFDRFYRVERAHARRPGGTGLGLAITHWIIKSHNGEILVSSSVGKGSEFTIILPKIPE